MNLELSIRHATATAGPVQTGLTRGDGNRVT
jgi:hypothetical protein